VKLFVHELRAQQLVFWRSRESAFFVFLFPPLLFVLLGSAFGEDADDATYLVAGLVGYAVANTALAGLAIMLVVRREFGILKRLRSTPLPASVYLAAALVSNLVVVALQSVAVVALGVFLFDADSPADTISFLLALVLGAIAFAGLGLAAAALIRSAEAVAAVVNVVVLPMSFLSGSFGRADELPTVLQALADVLPLKYLVELAFTSYADGEPITDHLGAVAVLLGWGAAGYIVARARFGWEPRER
jgi:ABC-2 type transport system permease protein